MDLWALLLYLFTDDAAETTTDPTCDRTKMPGV